ncbi:MAG: restriction endonuclease subunit S [Myxococcales bacterium]|nr:restriction endonuclease subunit S [Myxococcales bacterium]
MGDLAEYINGLAFKPTDWVSSGRPIIRIQNLNSVDAPFNLTTRPVDERYLVRRGDLLVSWSATLDAFIWHGPEAVLNQHIFKVVPNPLLVDSSFLYWAMKAVIREMVQGEHLHGSTMKHINRGPFLSHPLLLPPLPEQRRISAKLNRLRDHRQRAEEALDAVRPLLAKLRQSILASAFRGDLTADWRATRAGLPYVTHTSTSPLPAAWTEAPLGDLIADGPTNGLYKGREFYGATGHPILRISNFQDDQAPHRDELSQLTISDEERHRYALQVNDLVINRVNSPSHLGKCLIIDTSLSGVLFESNMMRISLTERVHPHFVAAMLRSPQGRARLIANAKWAVNQASINQADVQNTRLPLPPLDEQHEIVSRVTRALRFLETTAALAERQLEQFGTLGAAILGLAFRGELVDQDPSDAPASVLLERIRAARAEAPATRRGHTARTDDTQTQRRSRTARRPPATPISEQAAELAEVEPPAAAPPAALPSLDSDALGTQAIAALWLHGAVDKDAAVRRLADHLREAGQIIFQRLHADGPLYTQLNDAIDAAVKAGLLDRPKRGQVRACKPDATAYTADDWRHALLAVLSPSPTDRDDAIRAAAEWARDNCGLAFTRLRADGHIVTGLRSALNSAIRAKLITRIDANRIARAPDSPADRQTTLFTDES